MNIAGEFTISDLAREFNLTARTIRFYEDQKLIAPQRIGQRRVYTPRDRVRLKLILRGRRLGFSILEIKEILDLYESDPGEIAQLRHFLAKIKERRAILRQQQEDIKVILGELDAIEDQCQSLLREKSK